MSALRLAVARVLGLFRTARSDRDTRDEFEAHLSMAVEENMRRGMAPDDARRSALNALGTITPAVEVMHRSRGLPTIEGLVRDMRYAMRALLRNPSFTIVAVATLSIGMGAITAIYSVVDGVLFRPLPYPDSERLVAVRTATPRGISTVSGPDYMDWKAQSTTFDELAVG